MQKTAMTGFTNLKGKKKMAKIKTIIAVCTVFAIIAACVVTAYADVSSTTYVVWNALETKASAVTDGTGPMSISFFVTAFIRSTSTLESAYSRTSSNGVTSSISATAGPVNVTYPSEIPLVIYSGSCGLEN